MGCLTAKVSGTVASFINPTVTDIESARVYFSPTQLGEGTPSPENVREIVGRTSVELYHSGKNLSDGEVLGARFVNNTVGQPLQTESTGSWRISKNKIKVDGGSKLYCYTKYGKLIDATNRPYIIQIDENDNYIAMNVSYLPPLTLNSNTRYIRFQITTSLWNDYGSYFFTTTPPKTIPFSWKRLPDEYQEVEYIESDGGQYIDLPFGFDDTDEIAINMSIDKSSARDSYIVAPISWNTNKNRFGIGVYAHYTFAFGDVTTNGTQLIPNTTNDGLLHTWTYKNRYVSMDNGCSFDCASITFGDTTANLRLFYGYNSNTLGKIAYYKHKKANGNEYEFIPCYRKSNNEIGMFDTVSQTFYTNQGTGTFTKGNDVFSDEVYGGYVDLVTGEVWADHTMFTVDEPNATCTLASSGILRFVFPLKYYFSAPSRKGASMCTMLPENASANWNYGYLDNISATATTGNHQLCLNYVGDGDGWSELVGEEATVENVKAYLRNIGFAICATLRTPILMRTLTPQQLQTFKNENNIWSNGDSVEIDYDLAETFDIQKAKRKIIMNQPHVETALNSPSSSQVIKFKTDMKAPLKECKVSFMPIQEGSGDPSPTNIRPIKGWNGITLKHTGINMLQCSSPSYYIDATNNGITSQSSRNADNEVIGIDFNGTTTSTNIFRNLNYNPSDSGAVTMPRGLMGLTGYSDQVYVVPMGNSNAPRTTDGRYWTGANANSENGWNVWSVDSSETYNGLWVRTQVFPRETNVNVDTTVYPMMCLAEDVGCEFEPYKGETFDVDWTNEVGTVYGGYIDLANGQLVITHYSISVTSWIVVKQNNGFICYKAETPDTISNTWYCNMINEYGNFDSSNMNKNIIQKTNVGTNVYLALDENADILNLQLVMPLATPIVHQLTPQQIVTFKGQNNIWANTNKLTEIKYWNHKKSDSTGIVYEAENLAFDGTNYIDTGVYLFSKENINRDFEVVIEDLYGDYETGSVTIVCAKYDSKAIGFLIRLNDSTSITYNGTISMKASYNNNITIRRINGVITCEGSIINNPRVKFTNEVHQHPLVLGCALQDNGTPMRYATGTIGHITVKWL